MPFGHGYCLPPAHDGRRGILECNLGVSDAWGGAVEGMLYPWLALVLPMI
jgi:hypothetical protein